MDCSADLYQVDCVRQICEGILLPCWRVYTVRSVSWSIELNLLPLPRVARLGVGNVAHLQLAAAVKAICSAWLVWQN